MVVIWVGGHQKHVWNKECTGSHPSYAVVRNKISKAAWVTHLTVLASSATWSGSRCDSSFPQAAEISLWIFPRDLKENIHIRFETRRKNMTNTICLTVNSHISISAEASLPVGPKWILMNLPCGKMYKISMKCYRNQPANSTESMNQWIYIQYTIYREFLLVLTKRDELSFLSVLALPNASMAGFASMIWSSRVPWERKVKCHIILKMYSWF